MPGVFLMMREVEWRRRKVKFNGQPRATLAGVYVVGLSMLDGAQKYECPQLTRPSTISVTLKKKEGGQERYGMARTTPQIVSQYIPEQKITQIIRSVL